MITYPHSTTTSTGLIETMRAEIDTLQHANARLHALVTSMGRNPFLDMLNQAGFLHAIDALPDRLYTLVFCDVDKMKAINTATGCHQKTDAYLRAGFRVRAGEVAGQIHGDELAFILDEPADAMGFERRIRAQLRAVRLGVEERRKLLTAGTNPYISATFAHKRALRPAEMRAALDELSIDVLTQKARRDARG
jgi:GGDEF domain-containing protein